MKLLNLGCGGRYHKDWTNVNFTSTGENVIAHNLLNGIPFDDNMFDVVYHSHVLEHFDKEKGKFFIKECYRVLKEDGTIRCAVPDLEKIVSLYIENLENALNGSKNAADNYNWIMLEMYDQTVRNYSGGEMAKYLYQENIPNEKFVYERIGDEKKSTRNNYLKNKKVVSKPETIKRTPLLKKIFNKNSWESFLKKKLFKTEIEYIKIGKFRQSGEIHQWMYDRYSLSLLLSDAGFKDIKIKSAFESDIPEWNKYELDSKNGTILKPDSLFIEANK